MATQINTVLFSSNSTPTNFRAWIQFVDAAFKMGFAAAGDSGQVDLTTVANPTAANFSSGYKVYQSNDGLSPIFIKVEYGSGSPANVPCIWITIGTASNGAGVIGGTILVNRQQIMGVDGGIIIQHLSFASGGPGRMAMALFTSASTTPIWLAIERRKTAAIADDDTGIIIDFGNGSAGHKSLCAPFAGVIPAPENGLQFVLTTVNPGIYGNTVPAGLRIPCLGASEPPGLNVAVANSGDWGAYAVITLAVNGDNHTYKQCGPYITTLRGLSSGLGDVNTRLLLRFE